MSSSMWEEKNNQNPYITQNTENCYNYNDKVEAELGVAMDISHKRLHH